VKRTQITLALSAGVFAPILGIFLHSFLYLAYQHKALAPKWITVTSWILSILQWPCLLLEQFQISLATCFYDPHFVGSLFWTSVSEYFFVNFVGWSIFFYLALYVAFWVSSHVKPSKQ